MDVTKDKNPFKISLRNDNDQLFQQVPRGDIYFFTVEGSGKFPGEYWSSKMLKIFVAEMLGAIFTPLKSLSFLS